MTSMVDLSMLFLVRNSSAAVANVSPKMTLTSAISSRKVVLCRIMFITRALTFGLSGVSPYSRSSRMTGWLGASCLNRHRAQSTPSWKSVSFASQLHASTTIPLMPHCSGQELSGPAPCESHRVSLGCSPSWMKPVSFLIRFCAED